MAVLQQQQETGVVVGLTAADKKKSQSISLDALPYIDPVHEEYEAYALQLIEAEMQTLTPDPHVLDHLPDLLRAPPQFGGNKLLQAEYETLATASSEADDGTQHKKDRAKYSVPSALVTEPDVDEASLEDIQQLVQRAKIEHERQRARLLNLELQDIYEADQWKWFLSQMTAHLEQPLAKDLEEVRRAVDDINADRQASQRPEPLARLETQYQQLLQTNDRLSRATTDLKSQISTLQHESGHITPANNTATKQNEDTTMDEL
eukprot:scaffold107003_cov40-Attheya_sp.AAC.2